MRWLVNLPLRKLGGLWSIIFVTLVVLYSLKNFGDVPPGAVTVSIGILTAGFGGYAATSSWEATHVVATNTEKKWEDDDDKG